MDKIMEYFIKNAKTLLIVGVVVLSIFILSNIGLHYYTKIGTSTRVVEIKERIPEAMTQRGWKILRYEGYQLGSWGHHGGKVWYHVQNIDNENIQYRVFVTLWGDELHFTYGEPEKLNRVDVSTDTLSHILNK
jgi:hypothetical protein